MTADIHPSAIVSDKAVLGSNVSVGPYSIIGPDVELGDGVRIHNGVTIDGRTKIGTNCEIYPGAVLGKEPQLLGFEDNVESRTEIGERTVIREHVTIHSGSKAQGGLTYVGRDCLLMVGVHIAHDCYVSDKCVFANQVTLGGSVHVEEQVWIGGLAAIKQFSRVGQHAFIAGGAMIGRSIIPYGYVLGNRAYLLGLNLVGLRRRKFSKQSIRDLRAAYRMLFAKEGKFAERIADTQETYGNSVEVSHILQFIKDYGSLELTLPE